MVDSFQAPIPTGLSPHVRGNLRPLGVFVGWKGSIPARAGEPVRRIAPYPARGVYPRTCGGTSYSSATPSTPTGLSPHVRGNLPLPDGRGLGHGSIPARAGEPEQSAPGTVRHQGLSPHVRGNLGSRAGGPGRARSIPARAGEPLSVFRPYRIDGVYPRTCGGTMYCGTPTAFATGLSPHVRGNRPLASRRQVEYGSIPARAGEPLFNGLFYGYMRVYPRTCGGTGIRWSRVSRASGLSPHVRGNRCQDTGVNGRLGSIPARAGEPGRSRGPCTPSRVYPRTCGGTHRRDWDRETDSGLSPHVRGNLHDSKAFVSALGSIPARAGEPRARAAPDGHGRVYPRTCGGTARGRVAAASVRGLSPHVRGNRVQVSVALVYVGSIPARAGEP